MTPWTVAHQAFLSMEFLRQEYWSGLLFPSPGELPDPGIEPVSPALQADSVPSESHYLFRVFPLVEIYSPFRKKKMKTVFPFHYIVIVKFSTCIVRGFFFEFFNGAKIKPVFYSL